VFSFGVLEVAVVVILAIVLFPPTELPKLARSVARAYGTIRRTADEFKSAVLEDPDLNRPIDEIRSAYRETRWQVRRAEEAARRELARARMEARMAVRAEHRADPEHPTVQGRVSAGASGAAESSSDEARAPALAVVEPPGGDAGQGAA
jgi:Sec-independent protein translocase protein TatA